MTEAKNQSTQEYKPADLQFGGELTLQGMADSPITDINNIPKESDRDFYAEDLHTGIDFQYQACPFANSPSRFPNGEPHKVPLSGLERDRLAENYYEILDNLRVVRDFYIDETRIGDDKKSPLSVYDTREVLMALNFAAHYLVYRRTNPAKARGELPVDILVMSNAAAGSLAALSQLVITDRIDIDTMETVVPDPKRMINVVEENGHMVGEKTVCAASPELMEHFFKAVVDGPKRTGNGSLSSLVEKSEMVDLFKFGRAMYEGSGALAKLRKLDRELTELLNKLYSEGDIENFKEIGTSYIQHLGLEIEQIYVDQVAANSALGRSIVDSSEIPYNDFIKKADLKAAISLLNLQNA